MVETEKKGIEEKEPVKTDNGVILEKTPYKSDETPNFFKKPMKYVLTPEKRRQDTQDRQDDFLAKFKNNGGGSYAVAYTLAKIPKQTFWDWYHGDKDFKNKLFEIRNNTNDLVEDQLITKAVGGNVSAMRIYLESNHPKYNKRLKVETYTGDKTLEDILMEDEEELNKENNESTNTEETSGGSDNKKREESEGSEIPTGETSEDKKQEGEDSSVQS